MLHLHVWRLIVSEDVMFFVFLFRGFASFDWFNQVIKVAVLLVGTATLIS